MTDAILTALRDELKRTEKRAGALKATIEMLADEMIVTGTFGKVVKTPRKAARHHSTRKPRRAERGSQQERVALAYDALTAPTALPAFVKSLSTSTRQRRNLAATVYRQARKGNLQLQNGILLPAGQDGVQ